MSRRKKEPVRERAEPDLTSPMLGNVVRAERGREAGGFYIVVGGAGADRVYIADGRKRRLSSPKPKGISHITVMGVCEGARELLPKGKFTDGDIRRALRCEIDKMSRKE